MSFFSSRPYCLLAASFTLLWHSVYALPTSSEQTFPSYDYGIDRNTIIKRQSSTPYATTGIPTSGPPPLRLEIRELEQDPITWTLYLLGLDLLQITDQRQMLSWYQIAGIHGRPFIPFDDVQAVPNNQDNGYCTHVSILFPSWHRPYLALYEQRLYDLIQWVALLYPAGPVGDSYVAAAANFRIPYWDWAAAPPTGQSVFPTSVGGSPSVVVDGPKGNQTIANPLFSYQFNPLSPSDLPDSPFNQYQQTLRYPTTQDSTAQSQNNLVAQQLDNNAPSFRSRLFNLFTNYDEYVYFSNEAWFNSSDNPKNYDSIESVHDQVHGLTGSGGHMSYIDYAAFDPVFWLHHAMVDRCFAMWQVLHPGNYVIPDPATYNTFTSYASQTQDVNSPLDPFYKDTFGNFWTSAEVYSTETFGYAYAETSNSSTTNVTSQVNTAINNLYGPKTWSSKLRFRASESSLTPSTSIEWIANIRVKKYALNSPFFIHIFLGPFNPDPSSWPFEPSLVGTHFIFVKGASAIANSACNCDPDQMVSGTIPLTYALEELVSEGSLKSLDPEDVNQYLAQNLKYRVTLSDGTEISNEDVPSLKISVVSAEVQAPSSDAELPMWGEVEEQMDVSTG